MKCKISSHSKYRYLYHIVWISKYRNMIVIVMKSGTMCFGINLINFFCKSIVCMNKMTMFLLVTLFPSFSYSSFPTVTELCNAGAELFCCRLSKPGSEILPSLAQGSFTSYEKVVETKNVTINLHDYTQLQKDAALARYQKVVDCGLYTQADVHNGKVKASLISKETIAIAIAYKQDQVRLNSFA